MIQKMLSRVDYAELARVRSELAVCQTTYKAQIVIVDQLKEDIRVLRAALHEAGEVALRKEHLILKLSQDLVGQEERLVSAMKHLQATTSIFDEENKREAG
jgi:hypothetical protein